MANGPSKTKGLMEFSLSFMDFTILFFLAAMCVSQPQIFHNAVLILCKAKKVPKYRFVSLFVFIK